jgi:hypothetical protein
LNHEMLNLEMTCEMGPKFGSNGVVVVLLVVLVTISGTSISYN